jgi:hypothetical protein
MYLAVCICVCPSPRTVMRQLPVLPHEMQFCTLPYMYIPWCFCKSLHMLLELHETLFNALNSCFAQLVAHVCCSRCMRASLHLSAQRGKMMYSKSENNKSMWSPTALRA